MIDKLQQGPDELPVVRRHTRAQALRDGFLMDLTEWAKTCGFVVAVVCSAVVWRDCVVPDAALRRMGQSEPSWAHDLLVALRSAIARSAGGGMFRDRVKFEVPLKMPRRHVRVMLVAVFGPSGDGEPSVAIVLPDER